MVRRNIGPPRYDSAAYRPGNQMTDDVRNVHTGRVLTLNLERVRLPNGRVAELEIAHHPGGAVIVALDARRRVCLLRQFRHAAGGWITELPAGKLDGREPPIDCAQRELAEETGMSARRWERLGQFFTSPGVLTEIIHVFLARELAACASATEEHEVLEAHWVPLDEALKGADAGELQDAKTVIGLTWARARLADEAAEKM